MDTDHSRNIQALPFLCLIHQQRWIPLETGFLMPVGTSVSTHVGAWNNNCIDCHTTQSRKRRLNDQKMDTQIGQFGIACEACHGPGQEHIEANRNPVRRYQLWISGQADPTIANPARMSASRSSQVCGQCHGLWSLCKNPDEAKYYYESGFQYRPGDDLSDSRFFWELQAPLEGKECSTSSENFAELPERTLLVRRYGSSCRARVFRTVGHSVSHA